MAPRHDADYEAFLKALGCRIKALRQAKGWSQRDMILKHDYNDSQWRKYERGGGITLQSLVRLSKVFDVTLSALLQGVGQTSLVADSTGPRPAKLLTKPPTRISKAKKAILPDANA